MSLTRREFLELAAMAGLSPLIGCGDDPAGTNDGTGDGTGDRTGDGLPQYTWDGPLGPEDLYQHGVASGDPMPTAVILWTRVTPADASAVEVWWEIATDEAFAQRLAVGTVLADADRDFTAKIDAEGLRAGTAYYYRFMALGRTSPVGRTKTAPDGDVAALRLAVCSCASYTSGYFHSYRAIANEADLDAVVHLGDYIYEYGGALRAGEREHDPPHEIVTLHDYRRRYSQYRRDPDLQALHAAHALIAIWDDHETANNSNAEGAQNHTEGSEGTWEARKAAARQAYLEWLPIREQPDERLWRTLSFGTLAELVLLDTRIWGRDPQVDRSDTEALRDSDRTLLGADQEAWLTERLQTSTARWKLLGQQVMLAPLKAVGQPDADGGGQIINTDQWDGYQAARDRLYDAFRGAQGGNVVVLTGDIHSSWANDIAPDPNNPESYDPDTGAGAIAVEFVAPGVTSGGFEAGRTDFLAQIALSQNPHIRWLDLERRGYVVLDVNAERVQATWQLFADVGSAEPVSPSVGAVFEVRAGAAHLAVSA